jgi:hypothetical protein
MDILFFLNSLNKISLVAFIITLIFLIYEFSLFNNEIKKKKPLSIPDFKEDSVTTFVSSPDYRPSNGNKGSLTRLSLIPLFIGVFLLFAFGIIYAFGLIPTNNTSNKQVVTSPVPPINYLASKGIKIYTINWEEITTEQLELMGGPGQRIIIAIDVLKNGDIDMARIRINENQWKMDQITTSFNKDKNSYYKEYTISTGEAQLKIEAQLHSKDEGWLGD